MVHYSNPTSSAVWIDNSTTQDSNNIIGNNNNISGESRERMSTSKRKGAVLTSKEFGGVKDDSDHTIAKKDVDGKKEQKDNRNNLSGSSGSDSDSSSPITQSATSKAASSSKWTPYEIIPSKLYHHSSPFTISKAYLDLDEDPNSKSPISLHKLLHRNRILVLSLLLYYIILDKPYLFIKDLDLFANIFVNPIQVLPELITMHAFSFILPITCRLFRLGYISKSILVLSYFMVQVSICTFSYLFILTNSKLPIGTSLFLGLELVIVIWKSHSYFIIQNYYSLHNNPDPDEKKPTNSLFWYFMDFEHFLISPTLIYDQYWELKQISVPKRPWSEVVRSICSELYTSFAILAIVQYLHMECIFPALRKTPSIKTFLFILIPAEFNFQIQYYLLYHCVFSLLADISGFKDRLSFYGDYWSACTIKVILGTWSRPVKGWLSRHCYQDLRTLFKFSRWTSLFFTMIFSGLFHELLVITTSRNVCVPWSTLNLLGCGVLMVFESIFNLGNKKWYHWLVRVLLFIGHGAFYFAIYHLCYSTSLFVIN